MHIELGSLHRMACVKDLVNILTSADFLHDIGLLGQDGAICTGFHNKAEALGKCIFEFGCRLLTDAILLQRYFHEMPRGASSP